jgi:hypothetical protein
MAVKFIREPGPPAPLTTAGQVPTGRMYGMITMLPDGRAVYAPATAVPGLTDADFTIAYRNIYSGPVVPAGRGRA